MTCLLALYTDLYWIFLAFSTALSTNMQVMLYLLALFNLFWAEYDGERIRLPFFEIFDVDVWDKVDKAIVSIATALKADSAWTRQDIKV